jgi:flavin-dependent dehydrogenase
MSAGRSVEVAIVGGGPAGAAVATRLASAGLETVLFERWPAPRWRASGVYSSPATRGRLRALGLPEAVLDALIRPIDAMEVTGPSGTVCRLAYGPPDHACGLDRVRLERALLDHAAASGARVLEGAVVRELRPRTRTVGRAAGTELDVSTAAGRERWHARLVVGADGPGSVVARAHGVDRPVRRFRRAGLTLHRADPTAAPPGVPMTARMIIGRGWYCGAAPVPGRRVNIGIVMSERALRERLRRDAGRGPRHVIRAVTDALPGDRAPWRDADDTDAATVALPLAHRVSRRSGRGFVLVGDAAGFVDPLSGEGLHRALASAELAASAIVADGRGDTGALERYDRRMRARFAPRDLVSWVLQLLLARPALLDHALRRLAVRDDLRTTFGRALADLDPVARILAPRFLFELARP